MCWLALAQLAGDASTPVCGAAPVRRPEGCSWGLLHQAAAWPWKREPWQPAGLMENRSLTAAMVSRRVCVDPREHLQQLRPHALETPVPARRSRLRLLWSGSKQRVRERERERTLRFKAAGAEKEGGKPAADERRRRLFRCLQPQQRCVQPRRWAEPHLFLARLFLAKRVVAALLEWKTGGGGS